MGFTVGGGPQQGIPDNTLTPPSTGTVDTSAAESLLPLVEEPIKDQLSQAPNTEGGGAKKAAEYAASVQIPQLEKPQENQEEKKTEESDSSEVSDSSSEQEVQSEDELKTDQDGGQGTGGGLGGGDDDSSGGSFSGQSFGEKTSGIASETNQGTQISGSVKVGVNAVGVNSKINPDQETEQAGPVNPLDDPTVVTALGMFSPPVNPAQFLSNGEKMMQEIYAANLKFAESMPDGPDKMRFTDFLKAVQEALIGFQELLRTLQMYDSKGARERSRAKLETSLAKIEKQREEMDEIHKKQADAAHKMKVLGPLMNIFAFLMIILLAAIILLLGMVMLVMGPPGWMALSMLVCELVDQGAKLVGKQPFMMKKLLETMTIVTDAIVNSCADTFDLTPQQVKEGKAIAKTVVVSLSMALAVSAVPGAFVFGGVTALISFLNESHIVRDMQMQAGASEQEATMAEMYTTIAITVAFALAAMAAAFVMPVGAVGGAVLAVTDALSKYALKAAELVVSILRHIIKTMTDVVAQKIVNIIKAIIQTAFDPEVWAALTNLGLQTTSGVMTYNYEKLMADISLIQGRMDSDVELKETTIQILKKMIQMLLDSLQGTGQQIAEIGKLLKKTHTNVSQISSNLFG